MSIVKFRFLIFSLLFLGTKFFLFGQLTGKVLASDTQTAIPYVNIWIQGTVTGTTSNEKGEFVLTPDSKGDSILFSAVGYASISMSFSNLKETVELIPKPIDLDEVLLYAKQNSKEIIASTYNPKKVNNLFASEMQPKIRARFFPYESKFGLTPYLKKLKLCAPSEIERARFILRFYSVGENEEPGELIYDKNVFGFANKKSWTSEVDLLDYSIRFPKEGLFIAIEWLIIDENLFEYPFGRGKKKEMVNAYAPMFGTIITDTNSNSWIFSKGKWDRTNKNDKKAFGKSLSKKYSVLAMELTLSD